MALFKFGRKTTLTEPVAFKLSDGTQLMIPTSWEHVTIHQWMRLKSEDKDFLTMISILTGVDRKHLMKCNSLDLDMKVSPLLEWMKTPFDTNRKLKHITIDGKQHKVPSGLGLTELGQRYFLQEQMKKAMEKPGGLDGMLDVALAIYFYSALTGKPFDADKIADVLPLIHSIPVTEGFPVADFFLMKYLAWLNVTQRISEARQIKMKQRQALTASTSSESSTQSTTSQEATP